MTESYAEWEHQAKELGRVFGTKLRERLAILDPELAATFSTGYTVAMYALAGTMPRSVSRALWVGFDEVMNK